MIINLSGGVNTSDATAVEANVLAGNTFYAQGVKKTGSLPEMPNTLGNVYNTDAYGNFGIIVPTRGIYPVGTILCANAADAGITPEKIMQGQSILGVAGTAMPSYGPHVHSVEKYLYGEMTGPFSLFSRNVYTSGIRCYYADDITFDSSGNFALVSAQSFEAHHNSDVSYQLKNNFLPNFNRLVAAQNKYFYLVPTRGVDSYTGIQKFSGGATVSSYTLEYTPSRQWGVIQTIPIVYHVTNEDVISRVDVDAVARSRSVITKRF